MHSISDLTTFCRKTTGDVPARLVGASTTMVGSKMFLFGGRLVNERRMVSDFYVFDLETFVWEKLPTFSEDDIPPARYFHSAELWNDQLIIFGGMGSTENSIDPEDLCVLNDIRFFNVKTLHWLPSSYGDVVRPDSTSDGLVPKARYAHLSSITADRLFIIGGQDLSNIWLDDVYVYDLLGKAWVERRDYPRHYGTYRSVAVSADMRVRLPQEEVRPSYSTSTLGPPGTRFKGDKVPPAAQEFTSSESLIHLPYSTSPTDDYPNDIYLYSNYNFTNVKRELEVFSPLPDTDFTITDKSSAMMGVVFPPGLRFPTGAILGTHLIIAGMYLAHNYQSFSIWALDLLTMTWSRIDPGSAVTTGSWFRGCLWATENKFLIFGNRNGNLVEDYNRRLLSWDHVAVVDLEAFGIYQPPIHELDIQMQEFGLSALEEGVLADFEIICDDGRKIKCSRKTLEERWPWFKEQRNRFLRLAKQAIEVMPSSSMDIALPQLPGCVDSETRPDPRLTPRSLNLSEPYPITFALLQYFYALALITPLQHAPAVLSQLLVLSSTYKITHLESLVKHAMHRALSNSTSVGVYEVATLCSCRSLQIRALKTVMSYSEKKSSRSRTDGKNGNGGNHNDPKDENNPSGDYDSGMSSNMARPRGTSNAKFPPSSDRTGNTASVGSSHPSTSSKHGVNVDVHQMESKADADVLVQSHQSDDDDFYVTAYRDLTCSAESGSRSRRAYKNSHSGTSNTVDARRPTHVSQHRRASSAVSDNADREIRAVANLISPSLVQTSRFIHEQDRIGVAVSEGTDDLQDSIPSEFSRSARAITSPYLLTEHEEPLSPSENRGFLSVKVAAFHSESEIENSSEDNNDRPYFSSNTAFPAFHMPRPRTRLGAQGRSACTSQSDSDTPSLSSSNSLSSIGSVARSQTYYSSPPISPMALITPVDYPPSNSALAIIEERIMEDQETQNTALSQSPRNIDFVSLEFTAPPGKEPSGLTLDSSRKKSRPANIANLNLDAVSEQFQSSSTIVSPVPDSAKSNVSSPRSAHSLTFPRFISGGSRSHKPFGLSSVLSDSASRQNTVRDEKQSKLEEKKRKRAEAKARTEHLALELKERQRLKATAQDRRSIHSNRSNDPKAAPWDNEVAMYGGLGGW